MIRRATLILCALASAAQAEEGVGKRDYPASMVERPMILPRFLFQPTVDLQLTNTNDRGMTPGGVAESLGFGLDVGLAARVQAGFYFAFPVHPVADFGDFIFGVQANLMPRVLNLRFDAGAERIGLIGGKLADSFIGGVGLPYKVAIGRYVALIGQGTRTRDFGWPLHVSENGMGSSAAEFAGAATQSNELLGLQVYKFMQFTTVSGSFTLPIGLLVQPHPIVSLAVRTGYRLGFSTLSGGGVSGSTTFHFIPLTFDLTFCVARIVDLGFSAFLPGFISGGGSISGGGLGTININATGGYADVQRYDFWFAVRL